MNIMSAYGKDNGDGDGDDEDDGKDNGEDDGDSNDDDDSFLVWAGRWRALVFSSQV